MAKEADVETQQRAQVPESITSEPTRRRFLRGVGGGLAATLLLSTNCADASSGTEEAAHVAMGALNQALAIGDDSRLDNDFAPDVIVHPTHHMVASGQEVPPGLAGLKVAIADIRGVATDIQLIVDDLIVEGDVAAGRLTIQCTRVGSN